MLHIKEDARSAALRAEFSTCPSCSRIVGAECWNPLATHCLDCRPATIFPGPARPVDGPQRGCATCGRPNRRDVPLVEYPLPWKRAAQALAIATTSVVVLATLAEVLPRGPQPAGRAGTSGAQPTGVAAATVAAPSATIDAPTAGTTGAASPSSAPQPSAMPPSPSMAILRTRATTWRDAYGSLHVHVVVEGRNTGAGVAALRGADASYVLRDRNDRVLYRGAFVYAMPAAVAPADHVWFADTVRLDFAIDSEIGSVMATVAARLAPTPPDQPSLEVGGVRLDRKSGDGIVVSGRVVNTSDRVVRRAFVVAIVLDRFGEPLALVHDTIGVAELGPGEAAAFSAGSPETPPIDPASIGEIRSLAFVPADP